MNTTIRNHEVRLDTHDTRLNAHEDRMDFMQKDITHMKGQLDVKPLLSFKWLVRKLLKLAKAQWFFPLMEKSCQKP